MHKGPYAARYGDFYTAGALELKTIDEVDGPTVWVAARRPAGDRHASRIDRGSSAWRARAAQADKSLLAVAGRRDRWPVHQPAGLSAGQRARQVEAHGRRRRAEARKRPGTRARGTSRASCRRTRSRRVASTRFGADRSHRGRRTRRARAVRSRTRCVTPTPARVEVACVRRRQPARAVLELHAVRARSGERRSDRADRRSPALRRGRRRTRSAIERRRRPGARHRRRAAPRRRRRDVAVALRRAPPRSRGIRATTPTTRSGTSRRTSRRSDRRRQAADLSGRARRRLLVERRRIHRDDAATDATTAATARDRQPEAVGRVRAQLRAGVRCSSTAAPAFTRTMHAPRSRATAMVRSPARSAPRSARA